MLFLNKTKLSNLSKLHKVSFDSYGNAIPDVPSLQTEGSTLAASIVETRDIIIPARKSNVVTTEAGQVSLMKKILPLVTWSKKEDAPSTKVQYMPKQELQVNDHKLSEFVELSFTKLQNEFDSREQQLESRFQSLKQKNQLELAKKNKWLIPIIMASMIAGGYMLYILTNMQHSMKIMSASIPIMNQHIGSMAKDTQAMNLSMRDLNGNVGQMNNQVHHMNQQMGGISQSIKPMGDAAATTQPFLGMMRSFMPF